MPRFDVAHIRQQGTDLIITPLDRSFGSKVQSEQASMMRELQLRANSAGLAGTVVPVWNNSSGAMCFLAPPAWHPYFKSINMAFVLANVNREIYW